MTAEAGCLRISQQDLRSFNGLKNQIAQVIVEQRDQVFEQRIISRKIIVILNVFFDPQTVKKVHLSPGADIGKQRYSQISYRHSGHGHLVTLNPSLLKNCLINLISNAIKYSGPDSVIGFPTSITVSHLTIKISDNGIGIPKEDQQHHFEAFFRAHNTGNIPGTGFGLNRHTLYRFNERKYRV